nr:hypothetical protein CFP56_73619 [Quercus suber]
MAERAVVVRATPSSLPVNILDWSKKEGTADALAATLVQPRLQHSAADTAPRNHQHVASASAAWLNPGKSILQLMHLLPHWCSLGCNTVQQTMHQGSTSMHTRASAATLMQLRLQLSAVDSAPGHSAADAPAATLVQPKLQHSAADSAPRQHQHAHLCISCYTDAAQAATQCSR